ncbi:MAG: hypothetical protein AVDCRST_MAG54-1602, partial [uncultured Actinomycetospora sp.]
CTPVRWIASSATSAGPAPAPGSGRAQSPGASARTFSSATSQRPSRALVASSTAHRPGLSRGAVERTLC